MLLLHQPGGLALKMTEECIHMTETALRKPRLHCCNLSMSCPSPFWLYSLATHRNFKLVFHFISQQSHYPESVVFYFIFLSLLSVLLFPHSDFQFHHFPLNPDRCVSDLISLLVFTILMCSSPIFHFHHVSIHRHLITFVRVVTNPHCRSYHSLIAQTTQHILIKFGMGTAITFIALTSY